MKNALLFIFLLGTLTSCEAYRYARIGQQGMRVAAGKITSYSTNYHFMNDSIRVDKPLTTIENYFINKRWTISSEYENKITFEYSTNPLDRTATGKQQNGSTSFITEADSTILMQIRLRGNYNFGTKKKSIDIYNDLKRELYKTSSTE